MQDPLRVVFVEGRQAHGTAVKLLTEHNLDFSLQRAASPHELGEIAEKFKPHIMLCTDDESSNSNHGLLEALRLLCSQTPNILVSSLSDMKRVPNDVPGPTARSEPPPLPQDAAHLRKGFCAVLEASAAPAVISDAEGWITHANTQACRLLESCERPLVTVLRGAPDQCAPMPHWLADARADREQGEPALDATSRHCEYRLAYFDSWSLLPTLVHMDDLIGCLTVHKRDYRGALPVIALDRHGGRIQDEQARSSDEQGEAARFGSIVRISADDFLAVLSDPARPGDAAAAVQRVLDSIAQAREPAGQSRPAAAARPAGRHQPIRVRRAPELDEAMLHALSVQYQPQFEVKTGRGCGVEALARWVRRSGEYIAPSVFIPLAERSGLIHSLGAWMLKSACDTAYPWCGRDAQRTTLSVNVSALQIDEHFVAVIARTLEKSGFPPERLELEITESALIGNLDATIEYLQQWKELGVRIALDDFGTGYSSLSYLSRLPVDRLKLDQSLIHRMASDPKTAAVTRLIVSLGAELSIDVIAEGVETEQQLQMLADLDCPRVQGYLLGRPMPAKQAQLALRKTWGNRLPPARGAPSTVLAPAYA